MICNSRGSIRSQSVKHQLSTKNEGNCKERNLSIHPSVMVACLQLDLHAEHWVHQLVMNMH